MTDTPSTPVEAAMARARGHWAPPPKVDLADWIPPNVNLPPEVSAMPGPMILSPVQRGVAQALKPGARVCWMKPARIGATSLMNAFVAGCAANDPGPTLVLQPTLDDCRDWMIGGLDATLAASPALRNLLTRNASKRDQITSRRFPGGWIRAVAPTGRSLRRHTVKYLVCDETDSYEPVPGEGSALLLAEKRTITYEDRIIFHASTPTIAETSNIAKSYNESDRRIYEIECPHCLSFFEPKWKDVRWDKDDAGNHLPHTAYMVCPESGGIIVEARDKVGAIARGRWRATRPEVKGHAGFKCSALVSTLANASWGEIAREFIAAGTDPDLLRVWTNTLMGELFEDRTGDGLSEDELAARAEPFGLQALPEEVRLLTGAVDVQENRLVLLTVAHSATQQFVMSYEEIIGAPTSDETWRTLDDRLKRRFKHPYGNSLGYDAVAVDSGSGAHTDICYAYTRPRMARGVWSTKGMDGARPLIERSSKPGLFIIGVSGAKSRLYGLLAQPGHIRFSRDLPARYFEELTSERRITFYKAGQPRKRWERIKGAANEGLDVTVYNMAIRQIVGVDLIRRENELRQITQAPARPVEIRSAWIDGNAR